MKIEMSNEYFEKADKIRFFEGISAKSLFNLTVSFFIDKDIPLSYIDKESYLIQTKDYLLFINQKYDTTHINIKISDLPEHVKMEMNIPTGSYTTYEKFFEEITNYVQENANK